MKPLVTILPLASSVVSPTMPAFSAFANKDNPLADDANIVAGQDVVLSSAVDRATTNQNVDLRSDFNRPGLLSAGADGQHET